MFARKRPTTMIFMAGALVSAFALTACGGAGSSGTAAPPSATGGAGCKPVASDQLVLLTDDKDLQNTDNIVAVANVRAGTPALLAAVDKVGAALDQPKLLALNKAVEIDRKTSLVAAQEFATTNGLATGLSG